MAQQFQIATLDGNGTRISTAYPFDTREDARRFIVGWGKTDRMYGANYQSPSPEDFANYNGYDRMAVTRADGVKRQYLIEPLDTTGDYPHWRF